MNERLLKRLADVREEAQFALDLVRRHGEAVTHDPIRRRALERACEIVGEALRALLEHDPTMSAQYPQLPWREAIALRTKLAHGYDSVVSQQLVQTVEAHFPGLIRDAGAILVEHP